MVGVAAAAHYAIGLSWAAGFVLGAVVSPTDPLAATAIARRYGVPRRAVAIIEGESLVNDGTALVLSSSPSRRSSRAFSLLTRARASCGLSSGHRRRARGRPRDPLRAPPLFNPPLEVTLAFLTGYFAFLPRVGDRRVGVLAVVTAGVYMGWHTPELTTGDTLQGAGFWAIFNFLLNALLSSASSAPAAPDPRGSRRPVLAGARRLCGTRLGGGRSHQDRLWPAHRLHTQVGVAWPSRARSCPFRGRSSRSSPGRACEEPSRSQRRSRSR